MQLTNKIVYLLLGSNLGDREGLIAEAINKIGAQIGIVNSRSALYETAAWGKKDQPSFLNVALGVETLLPADEVLNKTMQIEAELGRTRAEKWGARLIDIDLILYGEYGEEVIADGEKLQIPHPRMQERRFVLEPLAEIAGEICHPVLKRKISDLLSQLNDDLTVSKIS